MKLIQLIFSLLLLLGLMQMCRYPLENYSQPESQSYLHISAEMTENYGKVEISKTYDKISNVSPKPFLLTAQELYVLDSKGNRTDFTANVINNNFKGIAGETYTLYAKINNKQYESLPEKMPACPEIEKAYYVFRQDERYATSSLNYNGFDVIVNLSDFPQTGNYYQWEWTHYERTLFCGTINITTGTGTEASTMIYGLRCTNRDCWDISYSSEINIFSDAITNGKALQISVARVPYAAPPLIYYLKIEQRAINKNVYDYLKSVKDQTQTNGSLFDVPSQTRFSTNIRCTTEPSEKILGVFNLFASRKAIVYVDRSVEFPNILRGVIYPPYEAYYAPSPANTPTSPCEEGKYRTLIQPEGWRE